MTDPAGKQTYREGNKMKLKLFLIGLSAVFALSGCSTMSNTWDWFFEDDEEVVEISMEEEMDEEFADEFDEEFDEAFDEEFADEFDEEFAEEFEDEFDEEFAEEFEDEFGEEYGDEPVRRPSPGSALPRAIVYFDYKSIIVPATSLNLLQLHSQYLINSGASVILVGHSDAIASSRYNQELALRRAQAVAEILVQMGVSPSSISTESRGKSELAVEGDSAYANAMNRRVELRYQ